MSRRASWFSRGISFSLFVLCEGISSLLVCVNRGWSFVDDSIFVRAITAVMHLSSKACVGSWDRVVQGRVGVRLRGEGVHSRGGLSSIVRVLEKGYCCVKPLD